MPIQNCFRRISKGILILLFTNIFFIQGFSQTFTTTTTYSQVYLNAFEDFIDQSEEQEINIFRFDLKNKKLKIETTQFDYYGTEMKNSGEYNLLSIERESGLKVKFQIEDGSYWFCSVIKEGNIVKIILQPVGRRTARKLFI